jgi:catechol 2,3-dioxygenase-like lactoylglutathione lyase family enzyme
MKLKHLAILTVLFPLVATAEIGGSYFAVSVDNATASSTWYQSVLGLEEVSRTTEEGRYDVVNLSAPGIFVELLQLDAAAARPEGYIEGPFKVGMLVSDIGAFLNTLPAGVERPELIHDERNALLMIQLRDPDNYIVQVMQLIVE